MSFRMAPPPPEIENEIMELFQRWDDETTDENFIDPDVFMRQNASAKLSAYYAEMDRLYADAKAEGRRIG